MTEVSVLITARNEEHLAHTVEEVLAKRKLDTEVVVVLDGAWANPPLKDHKDVTIIYHPESVGQRSAINEASRVARGKYIMKLDAHCTLDEGFDQKLVEKSEPSLMQIPMQYNLHVFDWRCKKCGNRWYQGPTPKHCQNPGEGKGDNPNCDSTEFERVFVWEKRRPTQTWRFDSQLHFQYWGQLKHRRGYSGALIETMSFVGACFFCEKDYFHKLDGLDEAHGSWGQFGTELSCKVWLSGGRLVCNTTTWYAHLFRTQGGDFSFPYKLESGQVDKARKYSQDTWRHGKWKKAIRPLSWLVEKFWPVPGWTELNLIKIGGNVPGTATKGEKGIIYYTDNKLNLRIAHSAQDSIKKSGIPIVTSSLKPMSLGKNVVTEGERGYLTMFRQILAGLEALETKYVFFAEHDVIYHKSHFDFTPPKDDTWYYNANVVKVNAETGQTVKVDDCKQVSGICVNRLLAVKHYQKRVAMTEERIRTHGQTDFNKWVRRMGFEPGTHSRPERVDDGKSEVWRSQYPNLDIRHGGNLTETRWSPDQFVNKKFTKGWTEGTILDTPGWNKEDFAFLKLD